MIDWRNDLFWGNESAIPATTLTVHMLPTTITREIEDRKNFYHRCTGI